MKSDLESRYFVILLVIPLLETIFAYLLKGKIFAQKISIKRTTFFPQLGIFFLDTFHAYLVQKIFSSKMVFFTYRFHFDQVKEVWITPILPDKQMKI